MAEPRNGPTPLRGAVGDNSGTAPVVAPTARVGRNEDRVEREPGLLAMQAQPPAASPAARRPPAWRRRAARLKRRIRGRLSAVKQGRLPRITVRLEGWDAVRVSPFRGAPARVHRLDDPDAGHTCSSHTLAVFLPDAAALARLTASGLLRGRIRRLVVHLDAVPGWLVAGVRMPRLGPDTADFSWRRSGKGVEMTVSWTKPRDVHRALGVAVTSVLRARSWDQLSGPVFTLDRAAWLAGVSSWPQGHLATAAASTRDPDELGRPLGPFLPAPRDAGDHGDPILTAVVNPHGRVLSGSAEPYRLLDESGRLVLRRATGSAVLRFDRATSPERVILSRAFAKYAVVTVDVPLADDPFVSHVLRLLAACGVVFTAPERAQRAALEALGLVTATEPSDVADLRGYGLSVEASRRISVAADPALRRTALAGNGAIRLPTVTAVVSSMRPDDIETCLGYLAAQDYPEFEVVVGTHGYEVGRERLAQWRALLPRVRVVPLSAELPLGLVLGQLTRAGDGELVTKVDDDDHYGPHHVTDLVLAWHATGADVVAKGARFVYLPDLRKTIDRGWAAPEAFNATAAGGTMLLSRGTLQQVGGWSTSSRHVDSDLITRVRTAGGVTYRTHAMEYVYVRRVGGHTWTATVEHLIEQGRQVYEGLPAEILRPVLPA
jgi:hypothetical protein